MKQINNKGFSIVIALGLVIIMTLLVLYILEYMIPYSKNVKGIQNSTNAFYQAESGIEDGLYFFKKRKDIASSLALTSEKSDTLGSSKSVDFGYTTTSSGSNIPEEGFGDSDYNDSFNTISVGNPIQLQIGDKSITNWSNVKIKFKVPNLETGPSYDETLTGSTTDIVINWKLSSSPIFGSNVANALNSSGDSSYINSSEICTGNKDISSCPFVSDFKGREGIDLRGERKTIEAYYGGATNTNCTSGQDCTLKFTIINRLELKDNNTPIPYLEYAMNFGSDTVPLRFSRINSDGKSYGFMKSLGIRVPQETTNEVFDFTVSQ